MKTKEDLLNLIIACVLGLFVMGIGLYFGFNYNQEGIYHTQFGETMTMLIIAVIVLLAINAVLLLFSTHQSDEDINRKKHKNNGR